MGRSTSWPGKIILGFGLISLGIALGFVFSRQSAGYPVLMDARTLLDEYFLGPLPDETVLERGMVRGMVEALDDPYSTLVDPATHELHSNDLAGEFGGIGVTIAHNDHGDVVLLPYPDRSGMRGGLQEGDVLTKVDGVSIHEWHNLEEVNALLRGPVGSLVALEVTRQQDGGVKLVFEILREAVEIPSIESYLHPSDERIGVIHIQHFSEKTYDELVDAFTVLTADGAEKLILDLRGNGGGLLDAAVAVSRFFLSEGVVLFEEQKDETPIIYEVTETGAGAQIPMVVLVDGGTASGGEVVAAALQENRRALLIGEQTYGKGSVQVIVELSDGSSLYITTARWFTPKRNTLDGLGLVPDIITSGASQGRDHALESGVDWLQSG
jgi:carboxyl-terminal processing protease